MLDFFHYLSHLILPELCSAFPCRSYLGSCYLRTYVLRKPSLAEVLDVLTAPKLTTLLCYVPSSIASSPALPAPHPSHTAASPATAITKKKPCPCVDQSSHNLLSASSFALLDILCGR